MSKTRTPPPLQPRGYEKSIQSIRVNCTETELLLWRAVLGGRHMTDNLRIMINLKAYELAGVNDEKLKEEYKLPDRLTIKRRVIFELQRHKARMIELLTLGVPGPKKGAKYRMRKLPAAEPVQAQAKAP